MSVEQWGVLALVVLLPLLEGILRLRRAHASNAAAAIDHADKVRTSHGALPLANRATDDAGEIAATQVASPASSLPLPLPGPGASPSKSPSGVPASHARALKAAASFEVHTRTGRPVAADAAAQWLRPVRNLRRAIVVATILGPPVK